MIKFDLVLLNNETENKNVNSAILTKSNAEAERIAGIMVSRYSKYKCPIHPHFMNRVKVIATESGEVRAEGVHLCCIELFPTAFR